jgi:hypothetical protein
MLRVPKPEIVAELNAGSSACDLAGAKQIAKANVNAASKVTLTSILSQRERRPLLPMGEGWDEGFVVRERDNAFKFETTENKFSGCMIKQNYLEADAGK